MLASSLDASFHDSILPPSDQGTYDGVCSKSRASFVRRHITKRPGNISLDNIVPLSLSTFLFQIKELLVAGAFLLFTVWGFNFSTGR